MAPPPPPAVDAAAPDPHHGQNHDHCAAANSTAPSSPTAAEAAISAPRRPTKPLTLLPLVALIFFEVSGGPFGTEDAVAAAGPLLTLLGFLILPCVWSIPEALVTAEMATTFPENSGYVALVTAAFGPFAGFLEGFFSWLSGVADNSVYPVLLADNLAVAWPALAASGTDGSVAWIRGSFVLGTSLLLTLLSYRGLQVVGKTAAITTALVVVPFVLLCALALPHASPSQWLQCDWATVQWGTYLNVMFWNLNYWDSVSCLAGEVANPATTFPRALLVAVVLVVSMYFFPTLAVLGLPRGMAPPSEAWALGDYGRVALAVPGGGKWLAGWILLAAAASQVGQYQAEMASDAFQLQGMAERGFLPLALARRSKYGTPTWGIALSCLGIACLAFFSFVDIISALNAVYALAELLEFAAFVYLRARAPNLPRPYRVPLSTWGVTLMLLPASVLLVAILALPFFERNWATLGVSFGALVVGCVLYPGLQLCKERGWLAFGDLRFEFEHHVAAAAGAGGARGGGGGALPPPLPAAATGRAAAAGEVARAKRRARGDVEEAAAAREPLLPEGRPEDDDEDGEGLQVEAEDAKRQGPGRMMLSPVIPESPGEEAKQDEEEEEEQQQRAGGAGGAGAAAAATTATTATDGSAAPAQPEAPRRSGSWSIRAAGDHQHWEGGDEYASRRVDAVDFDGARRTTAAAAAGSRRRRLLSGAGGGGSAGASPPAASDAGSWRQESGASSSSAAAAAVSGLPAHREEAEEEAQKEGDEEQGRAGATVVAAAAKGDGKR
jgi:amino acid transporter